MRIPQVYIAYPDGKYATGGNQSASAAVILAATIGDLKQFVDLVLPSPATRRSLRDGEFTLRIVGDDVRKVEATKPIELSIDTFNRKRYERCFGHLQGQSSFNWIE